MSANGSSCDLVAKALGETHRVFFGGIGQKDRELVAALSCDGLESPHRALQD